MFQTIKESGTKMTLCFIFFAGFLMVFAKCNR